MTLPLRIFAPLLLCALAVGGCTGAKQAGLGRGEARVSDPAPEQMRHAQTIIRIVNEFRTANGLPPVILEAHVMRAARDKAQDFRKNWRFYHAGSDGSSPSQRVARTGYDWVEVGETLSAGQTSSPRGAVANLKASPCHRFALLRRVYLHGGAAYLYTPDAPPGRYRHWWVVKLAQPSSSHDLGTDLLPPPGRRVAAERGGNPTAGARPGCACRRLAALSARLFPEPRVCLAILRQDAVARWYNFGYTQRMKTAISIRDEIFEAAELVAARMGLSRSELYAKAVEEFVSRHSDERITERLDAVYGDDESASALDANIERLQFLSLPPDDRW